MVHRTSKRSSLEIALVILAFITGIFASVIVAFSAKNNVIHLAEDSPESTEEEFHEATEVIEDSQTPPLIDLQPVLNEWLSTINSGQVGVEIFDLDNEQIVAANNETKTFSTESLYKLFVVYEGYRQVELENIDPNSIIVGKKTYGECLDLAIRESNSSCAEAIRAQLGIQNLETIIKNDFKLPNSSNINLTSTASDITDMMKLFYKHPEFSEKTWEIIKDSMLIQPPVDNGFCSGPCDWRRGLPSGFTIAKVYNKVGWRSEGSYWASYHDTAIVEFEELNRRYIITVMTSHLKYQDLARLGTMLEAAVLSN